VKLLTLWTLPLLATWATASLADTVQARCDIYPAGEDHASTMEHCTFSQRQGYVRIAREDDITYELSPLGDDPGNYRDQDGNPVYRESGLGDQGLIFRLPKESVFVYWDTSGLNPASTEDNWTAPFTTSDYDATTRLRCRAAGDADFGSCPAGILRMEGGQASVVVLSPAGEQFTINFMSDYVNASNREVEAHLDGDTWTVTIDGGEVYEVPLAAVEGG
jgi:hypothetical protein